MKFALEIEATDNPAMGTRSDVAHALDVAADRLRINAVITKAPVRDTDGHQVGAWTISGETEPTPLGPLTVPEVLEIRRDLNAGAAVRLSALHANLQHLVEVMEAAAQGVAGVHVRKVRGWLDVLRAALADARPCQTSD